MEALQEEIETTLQLLGIKQTKSKDIIAKRNITTIERHRDGLVALVKEVDDVKVRIEQKKLENDESAEEPCSWSSEIDTNIEGVDAEIEYLGKCLSEEKQQSKLAEKEILAKEREEQLKFEKEKLDMKLEYENKAEELDGTFEQWLPFWNKFCAEVDSTDLHP